MAGTTWNPSDKNSAITLSNGNLTAENTSGLTAEKSARAAHFKNSGKFYFEVEFTAGGSGSPSAVVGLSDSSDVLSDLIGSNANSYAYRLTGGGKRTNGSSFVAYGASLTTGDVLGIAVDFTAGAIWFSKNGTWQNSATIGEVEAGTTTHAAFTGVSASLTPSMSLNDAATAPKLTLRSSASDITGTVPSGFTAGWSAPTTGSVSMSMAVTLAATGTVSPNHGSASISITPAVSATGKVSPIHGDVSIAVPLALSAHGYLPGKGQISIAMPLALSASGTVGRVGVFTASMTGPEAAMVGTVHTQGEFDAPQTGPEADMVGIVAIGGTFDAAMDGPECDLAGTVTILGTLSGTLGTLESNLSGYIPITGTFDAGIGVLGAYLVGTTEAGETWRVIAMNLKNGAITEYESFTFNSMIEWNGSYYGANDTGIFEIVGDLDGTAEIDASARTARTDHGTEITKRVSDAYVLAKSVKRMALRVIVDEDGNSYEYSVPTNLYDGMDGVKADLGRGLRLRLYQYELANVDGADFECDGFDVVVNPMERRRKR